MRTRKKELSLPASTESSHDEKSLYLETLRKEITENADNVNSKILWARVYIDKRSTVNSQVIRLKTVEMVEIVESFTKCPDGLEYYGIMRKDTKLVNIVHTVRRYGGWA